jgi:hypothetical protein
LFVDGLVDRDIESAAEVNGNTKEAAIARRPGSTRTNRDIRDNRCLRLIMGLSIAVGEP